VSEKEYLDTNEAMTFLGVSRPTLFRLIKIYNIQTYTQVRNINYYKRSDLQAVKDTRSQFRPKPPHLAAA
jgi:hypothetical protein